MKRFLQKHLAPRFQTLKFKFMMLMTVVLILVVGIPVYLFVRELDNNYREYSTNMIEITTQIVYQFLYDAMLENQKDKIQHNIELISMEPTINLVRIYTTDGVVKFSSIRDEIGKNIAELKENYFGGPIGDEMETFVKVGNAYSHHHPIYVQQECASCHSDKVGKVIAIMDVHAGFTESEQVYVSSKKMSILGALSIVVILWILTNLLYQSQIESRLLKIVRGFDELAKGNFNISVVMPGKHELAVLAEKFNSTVKKLRIARNQEEQILLERLERADRLVTLGEIAAEIAHEVNNPAGIILARTEYVADIVEEKCPDCPILDDLHMVITQTERISEITRSILNYARKLPKDFTTVDLKDVILHSIKILEPRFRKLKPNVQLQCTCQHAVVRGNFSQLEQVFCNLLNNSLDVVPEENGEINIWIERDEENGKRFRVLIQDNGPGIPDALREQIFSPFFTTKPETRGTGLGLFISRNIVQHHNGRLYLGEEEDGGACFVVELEAVDGEI